MKQVDIIIAENHFLVREGLVSLIGRTPGFEVAKVVEVQDELVGALNTSNSAVVMLDYASFEFDADNGLQSIMQRFPSAYFLVLVNGITHNELVSLQEIGIKNFLSKSCNEEEILYAIETTALGKKYYSENVLDLLISKATRRSNNHESTSLTSAELEIVKLISEGLTTKQIANQRHLSYHTVMTHRKNIFRKMGVNNVSEMLLHAIKAGWIDNIEYYI